ncbi:MAG: family 43 glycosylhydrolase [Planctomycetia bacterium]|nr:family 43 glycosylhydrolase [Planctomycetia bacterium]
MDRIDSSFKTESNIITRRSALRRLTAVSGVLCLSPLATNFASVSDADATPTYHNPILPGVAADPEFLGSHKTGRAYLYPTTSGGFRAYSSDDLVHWRDEGFVLEAKNIHWETQKFWAPSIIERHYGGDDYRYFFYYCANEKLGVAVGTDPTGPFEDKGEIVGHDLRPKGRRGVEIDPFVFADPISGKFYLYWGNSYLCVCELNDDMISLKLDTKRDITPENFFEGTYVFYRDGRYFLTWSKNDTRDPNYQVWVATSDSPYGPFRSPEKDAIILSKRPEKNIVGTGHHSFLFLPNGHNYIAYHRIIQPQKRGGWGREVCLERFDFLPNGDLPIIEPTHEGVGEPEDLASLLKS